MDRINGADTIDIGGGRRGFRDENLVAGAPGTQVTALFLNMIQEEILKVITEAGLVPTDEDWTQLWQAMQALGLSSSSLSRRWVAVISMTLSSAPGAPSAGDTYLVPAGATGIWATRTGAIAQWSGSAWSYMTPPNGHGISLPDGRVFERVGGNYVEKIALDAQSGKWSYVTAAGSATALTASLSPMPSALTVGMTIRVKISLENTGPVTLDVGTGAIALLTSTGQPLARRDLLPAEMPVLVFDGAAWRMTAPARSEVLRRATSDLTLYVRADGSDNNDGSANTSSAAFATPQGAIDFINRNYAASSFTATINVNPGDYPRLVISRAPMRVIFQRNGASGVARILGTTTTAGGSTVNVYGGADVTFRQITIDSPNAATYGAVIDNATVVFDACVFAEAPVYNISSGMGASVTFTGVNAFYGGSRVGIMTALTGGLLQSSTAAPPTFRIDTVIPLSGQFVNAETAGVVSVPTLSFLGASNINAGRKFAATLNGVISTNGGGANFFPGPNAGIQATGGQYA